MSTPTQETNELLHVGEVLTRQSEDVFDLLGFEVGGGLAVIGVESIGNPVEGREGCFEHGECGLDAIGGLDEPLDDQ